MAKPKSLKLPKKPKRNASTKVLESYLKRVSDIKAKNAKNLKEYNSKKSKLETLRKRVDNC